MMDVGSDLQLWENEGILALALEALLQQGPPWDVGKVRQLTYYPYVDLRLPAFKLVLQAEPDNLIQFEDALCDRSRRIQGLALNLLLKQWSPGREKLVADYVNKPNRRPLEIGDGPIDPEYVDLLEAWLQSEQLPSRFVSHLATLIVSTGSLSRERLRSYIWHERFAVRVPSITTALKCGLDISADIHDGLHHHDTYVVISCIYALAELAGEQDVEPLIKFASNEDSRFQKAAFRALGRLHHPIVRDFIESNVAAAIDNLCPNEPSAS